MIALARLEQLLADFGRLKIALLGDLFLDRYLDIDSTFDQPSVETGLDAYQVTRIRNRPGALGTIINNLAALGVGHLVPVSVIGDDGQAYDLLQQLVSMPVDATHVIQDPTRMTPTYTKPMKQDERGVWQELNRLDLRSREPLSPQTERDLIQRLDAVFHQTDGLIVQDQIVEEGWGVVGPSVRTHLKVLAKREPKMLIFIDSRAHVGRFDCGVLKPNLSECLAAVGRRWSNDEGAARDAAAELARRTGRPLFCTMGASGMLIVRPDAEPVEVPGYPVEGPLDIVGAGDSATSGVVASLLAGATLVEAAAVGNLVASITVQQLGTTGTASPDDVVARWKETH